MRILMVPPNQTCQLTNHAPCVTTELKQHPILINKTSGNLEISRTAQPLTVLHLSRHHVWNHVSLSIIKCLGCNGFECLPARMNLLSSGCSGTDLLRLLGNSKANPSHFLTRLNAKCFMRNPPVQLRNRGLRSMRWAWAAWAAWSSKTVRRLRRNLPLHDQVELA